MLKVKLLQHWLLTQGEFEDAGDGNFKVSEAGNYTIKWYFNKVTPKIIVVKNK